VSAPFSLPPGWRFRSTITGRLVLQRFAKYHPFSIMLGRGEWVDARIEDLTITVEGPTA
jgi:hypothetical protein